MRRAGGDDDGEYSAWRSRCVQLLIRSERYFVLRIVLTRLTQRAHLTPDFSHTKSHFWRAFRDGHLTGGHLTAVYLLGVKLISVHLMGMYFLRIKLIGVHLKDMYILGIKLMGVHLTSTYVFIKLIGVYFLISGPEVAPTPKLQPKLRLLKHPVFAFRHPRNAHNISVAD
jgi:hypothetical protein